MRLQRFKRLPDGADPDDFNLAAGSFHIFEVGRGQDASAEAEPLRLGHPGGGMAGATSQRLEEPLHAPDGMAGKAEMRSCPLVHG